MLAPGQLIDRYELVCPIGDGGMAHVWAARQRGAHGFEKLVALKIIHSRYAEDPSFRRMFLDEARIVSAIQHRNVAQVTDLGEAGSVLYIAMEYVDGDSLFSLIAPEKKVPPSIAVRIAADACAGLHVAHTLVDSNGRPRDVVHRDVSPQNLLLAMTGEVKLIDFGIAHARDRAAKTTDVGTIKGKVRYMAPEQARRERLGPYTDVFGVGAVLFRMIEGVAPYAAKTDVETIEALLGSRPSLQTLSPEVPRPIAAVVQRAIAPKIEDRFESARALGDALEELLAREQRPDVAGWVASNLSQKAAERRARVGVASSAFTAFTADLPAATRPPRIAAGPAPELEPRPPPEARKDPSFMDVGALMAKARAPGAPAAAPPPADEEVVAPANDRARPPAQRTGTARSSARPAGSRVFKLAIAAIVLVLVAITGLLLLPMIVRQRALTTAREAGLDVTIENVGVGLDGITLRGVDVKVPQVPGVTARVEEIHLAGFSQRDARLRGIDLRLEGDPADLQARLGVLLANNRARFAGTPQSPHHLSVVGARMTWQSGKGERVDASDIGLELDSRGAGVEDVRGNVGRFQLTSSKTSFGPWASAFERSPTKARLRVMFDPPVPDGPSALAVWTRTGGTEVTEVTLKIARSSFKNLGIAPAELGLPADDATDVQLSVLGTIAPHARSTFTIDATLFGLRPKGFSGAVDVSLQGSASSTGGKPFELEKTTVTVGPFVAGVSGTVTPHEQGLRLDAMFKTLPMPCERLARAEAKNMGPLAATLQAFGQSTGALRVTGAVNASGVVKYDTAQPDEASVAWLAKETCGVSIFGM